MQRIFLVTSLQTILCNSGRQRLSIVLQIIHNRDAIGTVQEDALIICKHTVIYHRDLGICRFGHLLGTVGRRTLHIHLETMLLPSSFLFQDINKMLTTVPELHARSIHRMSLSSAFPCCAFSPRQVNLLPGTNLLIWRVWK